MSRSTPELNVKIQEILTKALDPIYKHPEKLISYIMENPKISPDDLLRQVQDNTIEPAKSLTEEECRTIVLMFFDNIIKQAFTKSLKHTLLKEFRD